MEKAKNREEEVEEAKEEEEESEKGKRVLNRKFDAQQGDDLKESEKSPKEEGKFKKAKNLPISMATKATSLARELKSIKSDFSFMQERCALLEEENRRLRDGFAKGIRSEEDDLVPLN